jgi:hypothetical protein
VAIASNTFKVNDLIAKASLKALRNSFTLASRSTNNVAATFGVRGFKAGDTVRIKIPPRYVSTTGAAIIKNDTTESTTSITLTQRNLGLGALSKDVTLSIEGLMEFVEPVMAQLAADIDKDGYALYYKAENLTTPGSYTAGVPAAWTGADVSTLRPFLDAKARLMEKAAPDNGQLYVAVSPAASAGLVDGLKSLFQSASEIADQYKRGLMGMAAGFQFVESQNLPTHTNGTRTNTTPLIDGNQTGASILLKGAGNAVTIKRGDQFTIGGVYAINPLTRVATNKLQVFSVQADATTSAGGAVTVSVVPSINVTSPNQTVSAQAADGATVTWMGAASASTDVNFAWHKDGIMVAFFDLDADLPGAEVAKATDPDTGLTVRIAKQYNAETDEVVFRADVLYGWQIVRGSQVCRVQG